MQAAPPLNGARPPDALTLSIAAVERDTGLSKDTLRVWERRYGFPSPWRDGSGERAYPLDQVERLRLVRRLLDAGHRPGRVVALDLDALQRLSEALAEPAARPPGEVAIDAGTVAAHLDTIRSHDLPALRRLLAQDLARLGLMRFVVDLLAPLNAAVGEAWLHGHLTVFEEHAYTEAVQVLLRQALGALPPPAPAAQPRVLLATPPGEPHGLGLLMAEAVCTLQGAACVSLGLQLPVWDTVLAARAYGCEVVALGFTGCTGPQQIVQVLQELRAKLPAETALWAGGSVPVLQRRRLDGVLPIPALDALPAALQAWRVGHAGGLPSA
jgi:DNA-binding transcriptional MerR regulator